MERRKFIKNWYPLVLFIFALAALNVFGILNILDNLVNQKIVLIYNPLLDSIIFFFVKITSVSYAIGFGTLIFLLLLILKRRNSSLIFLLGGGISLAVEYSLKIIVERARPENALIGINEFSFPSGHSTISAFLFLFLIYAFKEDIKNNSLKLLFIWICVLSFIFIGFTRIYINVHWLSDVLFGFALGISSFFLAKELAEFYKPFSNKKKCN